MLKQEILDELITIGLGTNNAYINANTEFLRDLRKMNDNEWEQIWGFAQTHQIWGIINEAFVKLKNIVQIPESIVCRFQDMRYKLECQYCYMLSLSTFVLEIFQEEKIDSYILKGITLNSFYPDEGMRKLSDVDIYVPKRLDFKRACKVLEKEGFHSKKEVWDYHKSYYREFDGKVFLVELHKRPASRIAVDLEAEKKVMKLYENSLYESDLFVASGINIPGLKLEKYALQILIHMMNHFLGEEFGCWLLCDWVMFWNAKGKEIDHRLFGKYLDISKTRKFAKIITGICIEHFNLSEKTVKWMENEERLYEQEKEMYNDILNYTNYGHERNTVSVLLEEKDLNCISYVKEVHRQMRYRFPRLKKIIFLWPVLWLISISFFLYNNHVLNRGSVKKIIQMSKRRSQLLKRMGLEKKEV